MPRIARLAVALAVLAALAAVLWWAFTRHAVRTELTLYGNVDLREVNLPFNDSDRVDQVLVQEGDRVTRGQLLARLDTARLAPQVAKAAAMIAMQQQALLRLQRGNRPQEVAEARSSVAAATADAANAQSQYQRLRSLSQSSSGRAVSRQDLDAAKSAYDAAAAHLASSQKALSLEQVGARAEDIASARAQLDADQADLAVATQQLDDAQLRAPLDAVVRSRLVEPGDISSPQQAAFTLAITDPKWVRAYVDEPDLGLVREGMAASVTVDSFPGRSFSGWVGFISPEAEFTPQTVETTELRSNLVYEVRVFVHDPANELRLGMPATVHLALQRSSNGAPTNATPTHAAPTNATPTHAAPTPHE